MKSYNLIFEMVILDVTVSASATRASFFLIDQVRNQCLVGFPAKVGLEPGVNDGAKRPLSRCQASPSQLSPSRRAAHCALAARCMNSYYNSYKKMYELVQKPHRVRIRNMICITIFVRIRTKISEKKICIRVGISTQTIWLAIVAAARHPPPGLLHGCPFYLYTVQ